MAQARANAASDRGQGLFEISRRVRFGINLAPTAVTDQAAERHNTFAGWPPLTGPGMFCELDVRCRGRADAVTGYMMNISEIDAAVRTHVLPHLTRMVRESPETPVARLMRNCIELLQPALRRSVRSLRWRLTPYHSITMTSDSPDRVLISQQFEFAAAHRLHCPSLSDAENRRVFGKCNNAEGHGHNYRLEPTVSVPLIRNGQTSDRPALPLPEMERIVDQIVIQRFDHCHLNRDVQEFRELNPSVEHIAQVCYDLLRSPIEQAGGRLLWVTVWETEKTSCTYPAPAD